MSIKEFIEAEQIFHNQARILGALTKTYISPVDDGSHTNMAWVEDSNKLLTREFIVEGKENFRVSYQPGSSNFAIENGQEDIILETKHKPLPETLRELDEILEQNGFDKSEYRQNLEFRFLELFDENEVLAIPNGEMISAFERIRSSANHSLKDLLEDLDQTSEIRVWEHNFDTGIYCNFENGIEQFAGYATADKEASDLPYFYNSMVKNNEAIVPNDFPALENGRWETGRWNGAILAIDEIGSTDSFLQNAKTFLTKSTQIFLSRNR